MSRLDLLWTVKFQNEKHEVETISTISRLLLENILPKHVAEIIMKENMSQVSIAFTSRMTIVPGDDYGNNFLCFSGSLS